MIRGYSIRKWRNRLMLVLCTALCSLQSYAAFFSITLTVYRLNLEVYNRTLRFLLRQNTLNLLVFSCSYCAVFTAFSDEKWKEFVTIISSNFFFVSPQPSALHLFHLDLFFLQKCSVSFVISANLFLHLSSPRSVSYIS